MTRKDKPEQKLVSFTEGSAELEKVKQDLSDGWAFTSLVKNGSFFVGIIEKTTPHTQNEEKIYIPPRKKIKIHPS